MRLFVGVGAGLTVGYFGSQEASSRGTTDLQPLARGVFGFDFAIAAQTAAILRVDYTHTFYRDATSSAPPVTYTRCSAISSTPASASSSVSEMARRTAAVALLIVPAVGLGALGLAIVASAGPRPGPPGLGAPHHFALRQAIAVVLGGVLGCGGRARRHRARAARWRRRCS